MKSPFIPPIWLISKVFSKHVFQFAPVTSTVWLQMQRISTNSCHTELLQQQDSPGKLLPEKPGSSMHVLTFLSFHPTADLRPSNEGPEEEALAVGCFTTTELPNTQGEILWDKIQLLYTQNAVHLHALCDQHMLKESELNWENWRSQPNIF